MHNFRVSDDGNVSKIHGSEDLWQRGLVVNSYCISGQGFIYREKKANHYLPVTRQFYLNSML